MLRDLITLLAAALLLFVLLIIVACIARIRRQRRMAKQFYMIRYLDGKTTCESSSESSQLAQRAAIRLSRQHGAADLCEITDDGKLARMGKLDHYENGTLVKSCNQNGAPLQPAKGAKAVKFTEKEMTTTDKKPAKIVGKSESKSATPSAKRPAKISGKPEKIGDAPVRAAAATAKAEPSKKAEAKKPTPPKREKAPVVAYDTKGLKKLTAADKKALMDKFEFREGTNKALCGKFLVDHANTIVTVAAIQAYTYGANEGSPMAVGRVLDGVEADIIKRGVKAELVITKKDGEAARILVVK